MHSYNLFLLYWLKICTLKITHVSELWVARLRVWDQFRLMLAVNSTLLSDDPGLKHFNAQEWKRSTHRQLGLANGSCTCILRKMQKDLSLVPLGIVKILSNLVKLVGFEPWTTQSWLLNVPTRQLGLFEMKCILCTEYIFTKTWNCTLLARKSQRRQNCVTNILLNTWISSEALQIAKLPKIVASLAFDQQFRLRNFD